jgi:succinate dehydrogenase/fumarate reductase flavoprotein subunit
MDDFHFDLVVVGSGAGGLAAALTASLLGLDVLVIEKEPWIGGTTAYSGGWLWVPCSPHARRAGIADSLEETVRYLQHEIGSAYDAQRIEAYLAAAPKLVSLLEENSQMKFSLGVEYPDYHPSLPGGKDGGRAICAMPFDGRRLGKRFFDIRPPRPELTLFGIKVGSGADFKHFANAQRSPRSAAYVAKRIALHIKDRIVHGRDMAMMNGNALVGRMYASLLERNVPVFRCCGLEALVVEGGRITGLEAVREGRKIRISAERGVILATGGLSRDAARRAWAMPGVPDPSMSLSAPGNCGDGIAAAERAGAAFDIPPESPAAWMPVSEISRAGEHRVLYPHLFDRGKPGVIAVTSEGKRFVNESNSYHDFVAALLESGSCSKAFLICDSRFVRRYGLGNAKPFPVPLFPYLKSGYLRKGNDLREISGKLGIDPETLSDTVSAFNRMAVSGRDAEFSRGSTSYNRYNGDGFRAGDPCLAPIATPPFYGVAVQPADLNSFAGLRTDSEARLVDREGRIIPGGYAVGADMASIFGGKYPGPGINLGPAMTFGAIAAHSAAGRTFV